MIRFLSFTTLMMFVVVFSPRHTCGDDTKKSTEEIKSLRGELYLIPKGKSEKEKVLLKNVVVHIDKATGDRTTNEVGVFEVEFVEPKRAGQDVIVQIRSTKVELVVIYPDYKGRLRLPPKGQDVQVWLAHKDDKFILVNQCLERWVEDFADANAKAARVNGMGADPDLPGALKRLAAELKLTEKEVTDRFGEWLVGAGKSKDERILALAAFARKKYREAEEHALRGASRLLELAGDSAMADDREEKAIRHYTIALEQLDAKHDREQCASISYKLALAKGVFFSSHGEPNVSNRELKAAAECLRERLLNPKLDQRAKLNTEANLARFLWFLGDRSTFAEKKKLIQESININRKVLGVATLEKSQRLCGLVRSNIADALVSQSHFVDAAEGKKLLIEAVNAQREALKEIPRELSPKTWASVQYCLGNTLIAQSERLSGLEGAKLLEEAVGVYSEALKIHTRQQYPLDWATTQNNLGCAYYLQSLSATDSIVKAQHLEAAVAAHREVLEVRTRKVIPIDWATTQHNLGVALHQQSMQLSELEGAKPLEEAIAAFREALQVRTREELPIVWASTRRCLAQALCTSGKRANSAEGIKLLVESVNAYHDALEVYTRSHLPLLWAATQDNLGNSLCAVGMRTVGNKRVKLLEVAVAAYREALKVRTRDEFPTDWAITQYNLGITLQTLGTDGDKEVPKYLSEAVVAYREALGATPRKVFPEYWAAMQNNLANTLFTQGNTVGGASGANLLAESVAAHREVLNVRTREHQPQNWAQTQNNLGAALAAQSVFVNAEEAGKLLTEAVAAYRKALNVRTREKHPRDWANTQYSLGLALFEKSKAVNGEEGAKLLGEAVTAYREALKVRTHELFPTDWASTKYNLGATLLARGERTSGAEGAEDLNMAVIAFQDALKEFTKDSYPKNWLTVQSNVDRANRLIASRQKNDKK